MQREHSTRAFFEGFGLEMKALRRVASCSGSSVLRKPVCSRCFCRSNTCARISRPRSSPSQVALLWPGEFAESTDEVDAREPSGGGCSTGPTAELKGCGLFDASVSHAKWADTGGDAKTASGGAQDDAEKIGLRAVGKELCKRGVEPGCKM